MLQMESQRLGSLENLKSPLTMGLLSKVCGSPEDPYGEGVGEHLMMEVADTSEIASKKYGGNEHRA